MKVVRLVEVNDFDFGFIPIRVNMQPSKLKCGRLVPKMGDTCSISSMTGFVFKLASNEEVFNMKIVLLIEETSLFFYHLNPRSMQFGEVQWSVSFDRGKILEPLSKLR